MPKISSTTYSHVPDFFLPCSAPSSPVSPSGESAVVVTANSSTKSDGKVGAGVGGANWAFFLLPLMMSSAVNSSVGLGSDFIEAKSGTALVSTGLDLVLDLAGFFSLPNAATKESSFSFELRPPFFENGSVVKRVPATSSAPPRLDVSTGGMPGNVLELPVLTLTRSGKDVSPPPDKPGIPGSETPAVEVSVPGKPAN